MFTYSIKAETPEDVRKEIIDFLDLRAKRYADRHKSLEREGHHHLAKAASTNAAAITDALDVIREMKIETPKNVADLPVRITDLFTPQERPRIFHDVDVHEIRVTLDGNVIRSWHADSSDATEKTRQAREFVEGWVAAIEMVKQQLGGP